MHDITTIINTKFDTNSNESLSALISQSQSLLPRTRKSRQSCLDIYLPEIIEKFDGGESCQQIADYLSNKYGLTNVKTTVWRRIRKFYEGSK